MVTQNVYHMRPGYTEMERTKKQSLRTILNANAVSLFPNFEKQSLLKIITLADDDDTCMDLTVSCNCYSKLRFPLQDTLRITDKNKLPVTGFAYGPFTHQNAQAAIRFNSLECSGPVPPSVISWITENECDPHGVVTMLSSTRLQYYIDYASNRKSCYVEFTFASKVVLNLTVSKLEVSGIFFLSDNPSLSAPPSCN